VKRAGIPRAILDAFKRVECQTDLYHFCHCRVERKKTQSAAMTLVKMFFNAQPDKLEETVQNWLAAAGGLISEVVSISQCECTDRETNVRGVLLTILYRAKKGAIAED